MIRAFRYRWQERLFKTGDRTRVSPSQIEKIERILARLDKSAIANMNFPGSAPHPLKGDRSGYWAVQVSANWRIIFRFDGDAVLDVDLVDYH